MATLTISREAPAALTRSQWDATLIDRVGHRLMWRGPEGGDTMNISRRRYLAAAMSIGTGSGAIGCIGRNEADVAAARAATEEFEELADIRGALSAGFRSIGAHVRTDAGGLGEVFLSRETFIPSDPADLDPTRPSFLFARLTDAGLYEPLGVGWAIAETAVDEPPQMFDKEFHPPEQQNIPQYEGYYGLHAWVFDDRLEDDPDELFAPMHPAIEGPVFVDALDAVRTALRPFHEAEGGSALAEEEGYENTETHISSDDGMYGVPFYAGDTGEVDLEHPPVILYRMTQQWYYELMGVEWYRPADAVADPPELMEQRFHDAMLGHSPETDQPEHFGLHAWLFRANPDGMFALYNPQFE